MKISKTMNPNTVEQRFAALEAQAQSDRQTVARTRRQMRATWAVSALAAVAMFTMGWHKDALAQGYGMTLAQAATRIAALETKTASMSTLTDPNTNAATVRFSGVNVQVVSGAGRTESAVNGTGNLIIGYNELRGGTGVNADLRTGSHNLVVGLYNNYSGDGGAVIGYQNAISNLESCVVGGYQNTASGSSASVSGGNGNTASGSASSASGGRLNTASGDNSIVSGGYLNTASGFFSSVSGGNTRTAPGTYNWVAGTQAVQ